MNEEDFAVLKKEAGWAFAPLLFSLGIFILLVLFDGASSWIAQNVSQPQAAYLYVLVYALKAGLKIALFVIGAILLRPLISRLVPLSLGYALFLTFIALGLDPFVRAIVSGYAHELPSLMFPQDTMSGMLGGLIDQKNWSFFLVELSIQVITLASEIFVLFALPKVLLQKSCNELRLELRSLFANICDYLRKGFRSLSFNSQSVEEVRLSALSEADAVFLIPLSIVASQILFWLVYFLFILIQNIAYVEAIPRFFILLFIGIPESLMNLLPMGYIGILFPLLWIFHRLMIALTGRARMEEFFKVQLGAIFVPTVVATFFQYLMYAPMDYFSSVLEFRYPVLRFAVMLLLNLWLFIFGIFVVSRAYRTSVGRTLVALVIFAVIAIALFLLFAIGIVALRAL